MECMEEKLELDLKFFLENQLEETIRRRGFLEVQLTTTFRQQRVTLEQNCKMEQRWMTEQECRREQESRRERENSKEERSRIEGDRSDGKIEDMVIILERLRIQENVLKEELRRIN